MSSSNRGMTVIIIVAVVLILGVRYFLSNREVVTEDDVRDKIEVAVDATQTAIIVRTTTAPTESNSAGNSIRNQGITEAVNSTIDAQETRIADLLATRDAIWLTSLSMKIDWDYRGGPPASSVWNNYSVSTSVSGTSQMY